MIAKTLLDIVACPKCKGKLVPVDDGAALECVPCGVRYPVRDGIPVLLVDEAEKVGNNS